MNNYESIRNAEAAGAIESYLLKQTNLCVEVEPLAKNEEDLKYRIHISSDDETYKYRDFYNESPEAVFQELVDALVDTPKLFKKYRKNTYHKALEAIMDNEYLKECGFDLSYGILSHYSFDDDTTGVELYLKQRPYELQCKWK